MVSLRLLRVTRRAGAGCSELSVRAKGRVKVRLELRVQVSGLRVKGSGLQNVRGRLAAFVMGSGQAGLG